MFLIGGLIGGLWMLFACVMIGTIQTSFLVLLPVLVGGGISLWLHIWPPALIGVASWLIVAAIIGADWVKNGAH